MRGTKVQKDSDSRREGKGGQIEEKLHTEYSKKSKTATFILKQQLPERANWAEKQQLRC